MKTLAIFLILPALLLAQSKLKKALDKTEPIKWTRCAEPIKAYGEHVRFTAEDLIQMHLNDKKQDLPYREWEMASTTLRWFSGTKRVSLAYIKDHMPRAMLLELRFPVDQNPPVVAEDLTRLLKAEKEYYAVVDSTKDFYTDLMKKYGVGPGGAFDQDMGGVTPTNGCGRYEEFIPQPVPMPGPKDK